MGLPFDYGTAIVLSFKGHKTVLVVCFQVVAVALPAEKSMETMIGSELTFKCNKDLTVSIWRRNNVSIKPEKDPTPKG